MSIRVLAPSFNIYSVRDNRKIGDKGLTITQTVLRWDGNVYR